MMFSCSPANMKNPAQDNGYKVYVRLLSEPDLLQGTGRMGVKYCPRMTLGYNLPSWIIYFHRHGIQICSILTR